MSSRRTVFAISDRTGITVEKLAASLLSQFGDIEFQHVAIPYVDNVEKVRGAVEQIRAAQARDGVRPLVFSSLVEPELRARLHASGAFVLDYFEAFLGPLEAELGRASRLEVGRSHGMGNGAEYYRRMDAVNFAQANDDGGRTQDYGRAELILLGVSRSGKTPTCLYLALHHAVYAANYPLTEEDLTASRLPELLRPWREKLFGLWIEPLRLHRIRSERRPDSRYASLAQCRFEAGAVRELYRRERIPWLDTSSMSIEEIATHILQARGLYRTPMH